MISWGDLPLGAVIPFPFTTYGKTNGESITLTGLAVTDIECFKGVSMTQRSSDAGYALMDTDGIDIDGVTGFHGFSIDTGDNTDAGFFVAGSFYTVLVSAVTIDSQTVNFVAGTFRLVAAEATAGVPVTNVTHAAGTAWGSGAITAASIAADAITDAKVASDVTIASVTGAVGSVTGAVGSVTGAVGSVASGGITAASFAANAINAAKLDPDVTTELQAGLATAAALAVVDGIVDDILVDTAEIGTAGAGLTNINLPNQTMDIVGNITGNLSGSVGSVTGAVGSVTAGVTLAASAVQAIWDALTSALTAVGSIGKLLVDNIDAAISSRLATVGYTAPPTVGAIADQVWDEAIAGHAGAGSTGATLSAASAPSAATVADAVWDELLSGHVVSGSSGEALAAAGTAGDPWTTALPGAYGAGTAGKIVGDNLPAILLDTAEIGTAGAGLTNIDLPNQTMNITGNITGNLSGSVGSVTGAVGSVTAGVTLAASAVQAIWDALTSALTTVGSVGKLLVDNVNATISSRSSHSAADVWASVARTLTAATNITSTGGTTVPQTGDSFARLGVPAGASVSVDIAAIEAQTDDIGAAGAGLTALATAANLTTVDTVVDSILALLVDARVEPGQGAPAATEDPLTKLDFLYKLARNRITQTATELKVYADNATTVDHKATVSDDGTTYDRGEIATGP